MLYVQIKSGIVPTGENAGDDSDFVRYRGIYVCYTQRIHHKKSRDISNRPNLTVRNHGHAAQHSTAAGVGLCPQAICRIILPLGNICHPLPPYSTTRETKTHVSPADSGNVSMHTAALDLHFLGNLGDARRISLRRRSIWHDADVFDAGILFDHFLAGVPFLLFLAQRHGFRGGEE